MIRRTAQNGSLAGAADAFLAGVLHIDATFEQGIENALDRKSVV
jgi:hypothetical protein